MVVFTTCGYGTNTIDNFTDISGIDSTSQSYNFSQEGKSKKTKKSKKRMAFEKKPIQRKLNVWRG